MKGSKYLLKNIGLMTLSQFGTKLLSFFLVPLYTSILTPEEYGIHDLCGTTVSLMVPILTMNITDAVLRFALDDKNEDEKEIFSIGIRYLTVSVIYAFVIIIGNYIFNIVDSIKEYSFYVFIMFILNALSGILINFTRGIDCVKETAISGIISSTVALSLNVIFLVFLHMGLEGYFLAGIFGMSAQCIYLLIAIKAWKYFDIRLVNSDKRKEMICYSKPLIVNGIAWWVNASSDRYVVTWLCGISANGIYSVAYKIPTILNIFQTIFSQAWTLSAVNDFDSDDSNGFFTNMYNLYNLCMVLICSVLIVLTRFLAHILYAKEFFAAWQCVPFLMISIVFGSLSGYIGGIFTAVKDSKIFAQTTFSSAFLNIVLNIVLVHRFGVIGAAVSTALCYLFIWVIRVIVVRKYIKMIINFFRDGVSYLILLIQSVLLLIFKDGILLYFVEFLLSGIIVAVYKQQVLMLCRKISSGWKFQLLNKE